MSRLPRTPYVVALVAASHLFAGCFGDSAGDSVDLDVAAQGSASPPPPRQGAKLPANAVTNWQSFFKDPPTVAERSQLEQKLARWTDDATVEALRSKGRLELALGRLAAAEATFRQALRLSPSDLEAQLEIAGLLLRRKEIGPTFEFLTKIKDDIATSDQVPQTLIVRYRYLLALSLLARGDRAKAHKILGDLVGVDRTFTPAYAALATSYLEAGRDGVAEFVLRRGMDRVKDQGPLYNLMGLVASRQGQTSDARGWFDRALTASPKLTAALVNRAVLAVHAGELGAAEQDLQAALAIEPGAVDALVAIGIVKRRQGSPSLARAAFAKAIDIDPNHTFARFNLAVLMADDLRKPTEAMRLFHEVMQTATPNSELAELSRSYINDLKGTGEPF